MSERYRTIVADPPWRYSGTTGVNHDSRPHASRPGEYAGRSRKACVPYPTLSTDEIKALPVGDMADEDSNLLLWTMNRYVVDAYAVAQAWGFRPSQLLTWVKPPVGIGPGGVFASTSEFVLYARRGRPEHLQRVESSWFQWPRGPHSAKPEAFLDLVEVTFPGPYLEMFARRARFGWDYYGDESLGTASFPGEDAA